MKKTLHKRLCIMLPGHWSDIMGGSQYQAKCIIEELNKTGRYDISYLTRHCDANHSANGYNLIRYGYPGAQIRGSHRHFFEMALLPKMLKKIKPDIIYQRVGCAQTGIAAYYALRNSCKMVWHIAHEDDLKPIELSFSRLLVYRLLDGYFLHFGIKHATEIIAQTEDQKILLERNFERSPSAVIPNFHPVPKHAVTKKNPIKIVWIANLKEMKQPEVFIRLAQTLKNIPNTQFIMIGALQGSASMRQKYLQLISQNAALEYLGSKSQEEVNRILSQSHIFVNTSKREGFPNTFIQAWMRQVPVVSLHVDPDRLIERYRLGFVSGSLDILEKNVASLISNSELRLRIGANARNFALQRFSPANAEQICQVFENPM